jgi:hypothetical protein
MRKFVKPDMCISMHPLAFHFVFHSFQFDVQIDKAVLVMLGNEIFSKPWLNQPFKISKKSVIDLWVTSHVKIPFISRILSIKVVKSRLLGTKYKFIEYHKHRKKIQVSTL